MNEWERREHELGKADIMVGKVIYQMYLLIATASIASMAGSISSAVLEILPTWANIAMGAGGVINLPGSVDALHQMNKWLKNADQEMVDFEKRFIEPSAEKTV